MTEIWMTFLMCLKASREIWPGKEAAAPSPSEAGDSPQRCRWHGTWRTDAGRRVTCQGVGERGEASTAVPTLPPPPASQDTRNINSNNSQLAYNAFIPPTAMTNKVCRLARWNTHSHLHLCLPSDSVSATVSICPPCCTWFGYYG